MKSLSPPVYPPRRHRRALPKAREGARMAAARPPSKHPLPTSGPPLTQRHPWLSVFHTANESWWSPATRSGQEAGGSTVSSSCSFRSPPGRCRATTQAFPTRLRPWCGPCGSAATRSVLPESLLPARDAPPLPPPSPARSRRRGGVLGGLGVGSSGRRRDSRRGQQPTLAATAACASTADSADVRQRLPRRDSTCGSSAATG